MLIALAWVLVALPLFHLSARADSAWAEATSGGTSRASTLFPGVERTIRACANRHRRAAGLNPLRPSGVLAEAARLHARNMAVHGFFSHTDQRGRGPLERVQIFDSEERFVLVGENIAAGYGSPRLACRGWMNSSGHRENILRRGSQLSVPASPAAAPSTAISSRYLGEEKR